MWMRKRSEKIGLTGFNKSSSNGILYMYVYMSYLKPLQNGAYNKHKLITFSHGIVNKYTFICQILKWLNQLQPFFVFEKKKQTTSTDIGF